MSAVAAKSGQVMLEDFTCTGRLIQAIEWGESRQVHSLVSHWQARVGRTKFLQDIDMHAAYTAFQPSRTALV